MKTRKGRFVDRINVKDDIFFIHEGDRSDWPKIGQGENGQEIKAQERIGLGTFGQEKRAKE